MNHIYNWRSGFAKAIRAAFKKYCDTHEIKTDEGRKALARKLLEPGIPWAYKSSVINEHGQRVRKKHSLYRGGY